MRCLPCWVNGGTTKFATPILVRSRRYGWLYSSLYTLFLTFSGRASFLKCCAKETMKLKPGFYLLPKYIEVAGCNWLRSAIFYSLSPAHVRCVTDVLQLVRNANDVHIKYFHRWQSPAHTAGSASGYIQGMSAAYKNQADWRTWKEPDNNFN